jgi:predicted glycosyltransferase involved in capsule biosynthesis
MSYKVSIVIPIFNLKNERLRNFLCIIKNLIKTDIPVYVSYQCTDESELDTLSQFLDVFDPFKKIKLHYEFIGDKVIHKSTLINKVSDIITTEYIWVLDADVYLDYEAVYESITTQDVIKPFKKIVRMTELQTVKFIEEGSINFPVGTIETTTDIFGPLTFILKKSIFDKINRMNCNFKGWGWEDLEFASRLIEKYEITELDIYGIHLFHPRDITNELENRRIFNEECKDTIVYQEASIENMNEVIISDNSGKLTRHNTDITIPLHIQYQSQYIDTPYINYNGQKIDLTDVSIVIPVKIDTNDRKHNLRIVLNYFKTFFINYELIVVEHDKIPKVKEMVESYGGKHISRTASGSFHKTYNFNLGISLAKGYYIAAYDCDSIFNPLAIQYAFNRLKSGDTDFIFPYNRYMVEINKELFNNIDSFGVDLINSFPVSKTGVINDNNMFKILYGSHDYECTGGALFFNRGKFFINGGYNPNIISYGCEDNEIELRVKKLGNRIERLSNFNCYHLEHSRSVDSHYNNFFSSNQKEFTKIKEMTETELKEYVHNGFKHTLFDTNKFLQIENNLNEYSIKVMEISSKIDLSDVDIIIPTYIDFPDRLNNLTAVINLIEHDYCNYNIILVEMDSQKAKYLYHKVGIKYFNYTEEFNKTQAINLGLTKCERPIVAIWDVDVLLCKEGIEDAVKSIRQGVKISYPYNGWFLDIDGGLRNRMVNSFSFDLPLFTDESNDHEIKDLTVRFSTRYKFKGGGNNGGCVFFDRKTLSSLGNYNENFYKWGYEDDEIEQRFEIMGFERFNSKKSNCYHMVHKRNDDATIYGDEFFKINYREFTKVSSMSQDTLRDYINNNFFIKSTEVTIIVKRNEDIDNYVNNPIVSRIIVPSSFSNVTETDKIVKSNDISQCRSQIVVIPNGVKYTENQLKKCLQIFNETRRVAIVDSNVLVAVRRDFYDVVKLKGHDFLQSIEMPSDKPDVKCSILYTTYAGETRSSEEYLSRFKSWKDASYELIAVIHDETASHKALLEYYKSIGIIDKLIYAVSGHGHIKGLSLAVSETSSELIIVANNDIRISKYIIDYCITKLENKNVGIIGWHYNDYPEHDGTFWDNSNLLYSKRHNKIEELLPDEIEKIKQASWYTGKVFDTIGCKRLLLCNGSFLATKKSLWLKIGGFDPDKFKHYFSDDYYCYGVLDQGLDILNLPKEYRCSQEESVFASFSDLEFKGKKYLCKGVDSYIKSCDNKDKDIFDTIIKSYKDPKIVLIGGYTTLLDNYNYSVNYKFGDIVDILVITEPISDHNIAIDIIGDTGWVCCLSRFSIDRYLPGNEFSFYKNTTRIEYKLIDTIKTNVSHNKSFKLPKLSNKIKKKFVCLTQPRVGFTAMKLLFDKHPDINLDQCIFGNDSMSNIAMGIGGNKKNNPVEFVDSYFDLMGIESYKSILGFRFKSWDEPLNFVSKHLVNMDDVKKIIIIRENLLMACVDCAIAHKTNIWQTIHNIEVFPQMEIDIEWAGKWLIDCKNTVNGWKDTFEVNNKDYLLVSYEDIMFDKKVGLNKIYEYLDTPKLKLPFVLKPTINQIAFDNIKNLDILNDKFGKEFGLIE